MVVHIEGTGGGHRQERAEFRTADAAEVYVRESRKEFVFIAIRGRPPPAVLVPDVVVRAHDVERRYTHHSVRAYGSRIRSPEVRGADERVHVIGRLLDDIVLRRSRVCGGGRKNSPSRHGRQDEECIS